MHNWILISGSGLVTLAAYGLAQSSNVPDSFTWSEPDGDNPESTDSEAGLASYDGYESFDGAIVEPQISGDPQLSGADELTADELTSEALTEASEDPSDAPLLDASLLPEPPIYGEDYYPLGFFAHIPEEREAEIRELENLINVPSPDIADVYPAFAAEASPVAHGTPAVPEPTATVAVSIAEEPIVASAAPSEKPVMVTAAASPETTGRVSATASVSVAVAPATTTASARISSSQLLSRLSESRTAAQISQLRQKITRHLCEQAQTAGTSLSDRLSCERSGNTVAHQDNLSMELLRSEKTTAPHFSKPSTGLAQLTNEP